MNDELIKRSDVINILEKAEYHIDDDAWNDDFNSFTKEIYRGVYGLPFVNVIELPCKVGDNCYYVDSSKSKIYPAIVSGISIKYSTVSQSMVLFLCDNDIPEEYPHSADEINRTLFFTQEEAVKALEGLNND